MTAAAAVALVLSLPFLFVLARRPVLRRLAVRNALRRPREAMLVVTGSLLGAAIITGSFVVGDTMDRSIRQLARAHLGPVDELVLARDRAQWSEMLRRIQPLEWSPDVDGVLPFASLPGAATSAGRAHVRAAPRTQILTVDFSAAHDFGRDPGSTGIAGQTPALGHAAITKDLANALESRVGDLVYLYAYGARTRVEVDRILPRRGLAGFWVGPEQEARNVFVSPVTFERMLRAGTASGTPPQWMVAVSNAGGVESGVGLTPMIERAIHLRSSDLGTQVVTVKRSAIDTADTVGKSFSQMFTAMGSFGVLAGLLLLVNLFVMLAAERKPELGMARAVGMKRSWLVGGFATEGWLYALAASVLGAFVGIGLGRLIVAASQRAFASEHNQVQLFFTVRPRSIAEGFAIGFVVALVTVVATSIRVSRLNIIRAIRDIPEPTAARIRRRWLVAGSLVAALGGSWVAFAFPAREPWGLLLAPMLVAAGLIPLVSRLAPRSTVVTIACAFVVVWGIAVNGIFSKAFEGSGIPLFVAQGVALTTATVVLVSTQQARIGNALRRVFGARRLSLRLALAYPLARRSRTGLTVAMYALVVFILTFITTLSHLINNQVDTATQQVSGGFNVVVSSSPANPIRLAELASRPGVTAVAPLATTSAQFTTAGIEPTMWNVTAFDASLVQHGPPTLDDRGSYPTDLAAWRAVLRDPSLIIVDPVFLQKSGGPPTLQVRPGRRLTITDPFTGGRRAVTVAAIAPADYFINNGALYGASGARSLFGKHVVESRAYVAVRGDAEKFAADVQGAYLRNGAESSSIRTLMDEAFAMTNQIFQLFEGYLAMGLLVGVAGLAVVMIRAVRERRRQIGTLRALGFRSRLVGRSFALEAGFVALEGTIIGAVLALATLYNIVKLSDAMGDYDRFTVPYLTLAILLGGTLVASLVATIWPAVNASRIRPAVALRTTD